LMLDVLRGVARLRWVEALPVRKPQSDVTLYGICASEMAEWTSSSAYALKLPQARFVVHSPTMATRISTKFEGRGARTAEGDDTDGLVATIRTVHAGKCTYAAIPKGLAERMGTET